MIKSSRKHPDYVIGRTSLLLKSDSILCIDLLWNVEPKEHLYYTKNKLFETPGFRRIISQNKIALSETFLHFVDNEELGDSYNKSAKIQPTLEKLLESFE